MLSNLVQISRLSIRCYGVLRAVLVMWSVSGVVLAFRCVVLNESIWLGACVLSCVSTTLNTHFFPSVFDVH
jgi:hypothetical protein